MAARVLVLGVVLVGAVTLGARQSDDDPAAMHADEVAAQVGAYVEHYYARTQRLLADEQVTLQPLTASMAFAGLPRRLLYELRVEWDPETVDGEDDARIVRRLIRASGPALGPPTQPDCLDPKAISPEPLAFLLPDRQGELRFRHRGTAWLGDREVVRLAYDPLAPQPATITWKGECGHIELPGRMRGQLWVDPDTGAILRMDEHLVGIVELPGRDETRRPDPRRWFTVERIDTTIRYDAVTFEEPDEILILPVRIENTTVIRNSGVPRLRTTRTFGNYRRFLTESRLVAPRQNEGQ